MSAESTDHKKRHTDTQPDRRIDSDGCLFNCGEHGEWKERLKALDYIPDILTWMNSVRDGLTKLPDLIDWMNREEGAKFSTRLILGGLTAIFLTGFMSSAWMFKSDMQDNLSAFKLESTERINIFKSELSERQAALKLEVADRQRVYEQNAKDRNQADTARINLIVDAISEMRTQVNVMLKLSEQERDQGKLDRKESKELIKDLQTMVLEHRSVYDMKKPVK